MTDTIPVAQLRAFVERIERIEADIKDLNGDKSEVYKELRGCGFDVKAVRSVVSKRKLDTADREERDAMFDLYWSALNGTGTEDATRVHVHGASYSEAKGRDAGSSSGRTADFGSADVGSNPAPVTSPVGELTDNQDQIGGNGTDLPVEASTDKQAAGASRPTNSNSQASPPPADSAGEAPSSSQASPATLSDDIDLTIPDFLRRTEGGYPKREAVDA